MHRAGELTPIWIPDTAHEAMRDLVRARATAGQVLSKARQHLQGFLLRHERVCRGARAWTLAYRRWLTSVLTLLGSEGKGVAFDPALLRRALNGEMGMGPGR